MPAAGRPAAVSSTCVVMRPILTSNQRHVPTKALSAKGEFFGQSCDEMRHVALRHPAVYAGVPRRNDQQNMPTQIAILDDDHVIRMVRYALSGPGEITDQW